MSGTYDPRITMYFGDGLLQAGFMPLPHLFLRHYREVGLSSLQALFTLQLMEIAWDLAAPPTTMARIAERLGVAVRTLRETSKELQAKGLIVVYDQFDDAGAQVENGYDLSPLFARLTVFAPDASPGPHHVRRPRTTQQEMATPSPGAVPPPPPGAVPPPPLEVSRRPPRLPGSGLKGETKNLKKQQKNLFAAVSAPVFGTDSVQRPLSNAVLAHCGLNPNVVGAVGPALTAAEAWTVWSYARGARLGPAWIAKQLYDPTTGCARPAPDLPANAEAGEKLAALPLADAARVLDLVDRSCPDTAETLHADSWLAAMLASPLGSAIREALDSLWGTMAQQRMTVNGKRSGSRVGQHTIPSQLALEMMPPAHTSPAAALWSGVRAQLQRDVPADEWSTWIAPLALLDLVDEVAVIGTPNVFVRDAVQSRYQEPLAARLAEHLGRPVQVEMVIGGVSV